MAARQPRSNSQTKAEETTAPSKGTLPTAKVGNSGEASTGVREKTVTEMTNGTKREDF